METNESNPSSNETLGQIRDSVCLQTKSFIENFHHLGFPNDELAVLDNNSKRNLAKQLIELGALKHHPYTIFNRRDYETPLQYILVHKTDILDTSLKSIQTIEKFIETWPETYQDEVNVTPETLYSELEQLTESLNNVTIAHLRLQHHLECFIRCSKRYSALENQEKMAKEFYKIAKALINERNSYFASSAHQHLENYFKLYTGDAQRILYDYKGLQNTTFELDFLATLEKASIELEIAILTKQL